MASVEPCHSRPPGRSRYRHNGPVDNAHSRLAALPRAGLVSDPTPLHRARRLSSATGADIWLKRDDVGAVATAGNKIRKYDLVLGDALQRGAEVLITTGAAQSNSARAGAAAAVLCGLRCRLILAGDRPPRAAANLLLDELLGAEIDFAGDVPWSVLEDAVVAAAQASAVPAVVAPVGCSSPLGSLGFALAYLELRQQCQAASIVPSAIVHASSSLGTHAGLLVGRALVGDSVPIIGVDVGAIYEDLPAAADALARDAAAVIGLDLPRPGSDIRSDFLGPGYAIPDAATAEAIELFAQTEAVILDPVYSGKGASGALRLAPEFHGPLVFWHTGGYHALFDPPHADALAAAR